MAGNIVNTDIYHVIETETKKGNTSSRKDNLGEGGGIRNRGRGYKRRNKENGL